MPRVLISSAIHFFLGSTRFPFFFEMRRPPPISMSDFFSRRRRSIRSLKNLSHGFIHGNYRLFATALQCGARSASEMFFMRLSQVYASTFLRALCARDSASEGSREATMGRSEAMYSKSLSGEV